MIIQYLKFIMPTPSAVADAFAQDCIILVVISTGGRNRFKSNNRYSWLL